MLRKNAARPAGAVCVVTHLATGFPSDETLWAEVSQLSTVFFFFLLLAGGAKHSGIHPYLRVKNNCDIILFDHS